MLQTGLQVQKDYYFKEKWLFCKTARLQQPEQILKRHLHEREVK